MSECVDDLSQIMDDLDLNIRDFPKARSKFCSLNHFFDEDDEDEDIENRNNSDDSNSQKECDCKYGDSDNSENKPKKSVRFDERVYETVFFASRLYDRRYFAKYHFSSRHHPPTNLHNKSKKSRHQASSKSESEDDYNGSTLSLKSDTSNGCKLSKSQRSKQSKKDKKRRLSKRGDGNDTSSDDQGYCSSLHSFSD